MEVHCSNGTLRMQGIAANQRRTAEETITYSKLGGSNLYCKCSSLEDVIIWGLPRTRICLESRAPCRKYAGIWLPEGIPSIWLQKFLRWPYGGCRTHPGFPKYSLEVGTPPRAPTWSLRLSPQLTTSKIRRRFTPGLCFDSRVSFDFSNTLT